MEFIHFLIVYNFSNRIKISIKISVFCAPLLLHFIYKKIKGKSAHIDSKKEKHLLKKCLRFFHWCYRLFTKYSLSSKNWKQACSLFIEKY